MRIRIPGALGGLAAATLGAGCAGPMYQPPEPSYATRHCPTGEVVTCMGGYATRMEPPPPQICICQPASSVQR